MRSSHSPATSSATRPFTPTLLTTPSTRHRPAAPASTQTLPSAPRPCRCVVGRASSQAFDAATNRIFQTDAGSWVVGPRSGQPTKGVLHFLGGAFAGAAPQLLYSLLLDQVADAGYTAVATPYAVTFRHEECAEAVRQQFLASLQELQVSAAMADLAPPGAPLLGMGHSMGSHLHLLIGSYYNSPYSANALMSYNNKQVSDAIPIPGFLEALGPSVQAARAAAAASPLPLPPLPTGSQALAAAASFLPPALWAALDGPSSGEGGGRLRRAGLALDQLGAVVEEVGNGVSGFTPSPQECRRLVGTQYSVQRTLLVRFIEDTIDETADMEAVLRAREEGRGTTSTLLLPGSHVTPCGGDGSQLLDALRGRPSSSFSNGRDGRPRSTGGGAVELLDAASQLLVRQSQADVRRLGGRLVAWLDSSCAAYPQRPASSARVSGSAQ